MVGIYVLKNLGGENQAVENEVEEMKVKNNAKNEKRQIVLPAVDCAGQQCCGVTDYAVVWMQGRRKSATRADRLTTRGTKKDVLARMTSVLQNYQRSIISAFRSTCTTACHNSDVPSKEVQGEAKACLQYLPTLNLHLDVSPLPPALYAARNHVNSILICTLAPSNAAATPSTARKAARERGRGGRDS